VTGATAGIGRATAEALARRGGTLVLACRSRERALPVVDAIRRARGSEAAHFVHLDLANLELVRAPAESFGARAPAQPGAAPAAPLPPPPLSGRDLSKWVHHRVS
jgi:NAD(P)-dependent dehydrogenase (short-subunit alcohol dehydrogenase family)